MKQFLIRLLFRLLDRDVTRVDNVKIEQWLAQTAQDLRFIEYVQHRDLHLLKTLGSGLSKEDMVITTAKRFELLAFFNSAMRAKNKLEKEKAAKLKKVESIKNKKK